MPVNILRLNAKKSQPNPHIVFIKPLKGPDEDVAREFLERIAAQCVPIMREHHLSVMTLEEYEPNREFVGRNFNAGEVVQLVLKARGSGRWLPFSYVQMVMMHELAHCRQMNHSRAFWAVRDAYAAHMRRLWSQGYTGEGIWGRGAKLGAADGGPPVYERNVALPGADDDVLLEHLCGGTYRSRRKRKPVLSYRERQDRRIRRKFGVNGVALGDDLAERAKLDPPPPQKSGRAGPASRSRIIPTKTEQKRLATKPRVAVSKRGRELRAAAALARFEQNQKEAKEEASKLVKTEENDEETEEEVKAAIKREEDVDLSFESDSDSAGEDAELPELSGPDAVDIDGTRMLDGQGRGMVRVCEGENTEDDADAKRELRELLQISSRGCEGRRQEQKHQLQAKKPEGSVRPSSDIGNWAKPVETQATARVSRRKDPVPEAKQKAPKEERLSSAVKREIRDEDAPTALSNIPLAGPTADRQRSRSSTDIASIPGEACPICSFANSQLSVTCAVCGHVLHADAVPGAWHCQSAACLAGNGGRYVNAGDCGVCGVCGERRSAIS